jgi:hypothetical protein
MKKKSKLPHPHWRPMYDVVTDSPAYLDMSPGPRALFVELKKLYNRKNQGAVYLSKRRAAKRLKSSETAVLDWFRELKHYGFIVQVKAAEIGKDGRAAHYRLADEPYLGQPPSMEFTFWNGVSFVPASTERRIRIGRQADQIGRQADQTRSPGRPNFPADSKKPNKTGVLQKSDRSPGSPYLVSSHLVCEAETRDRVETRPDDGVVVPIGAAAEQRPWNEPQITEITDPALLAIFGVMPGRHIA